MERPDTSRQQSKRRRYVVAGFQGRYVVAQLLWFAAFLAMFAIILFAPLAWTLAHADPAGATVAAESFLTLHKTVWPLLALLFAGAAWVTVRMSHRIAGPLFRLRRTCAEVGSGNLALRVRLREKDYLTEEAAAFDRMVSELRDRVSRAQQAARESAAGLGQLAELGYPMSAPEFQRLSQSLHDANAALDGFVVSNETPEDHDEPPTETRQPQPETEAAGATDLPAGRTLDRGFTLVELMIVVGLITVLASIAVPVYRSALETARVTRAVADIRTVMKELMMYTTSGTCLPDLDALGHGDMKDPWGRPYVLAVFRVGSGKKATCSLCSGTCTAPGQAKKDGKTGAINTDFDLYSLGPDGQTAANINNKKSLDDIIRGRNGSFVGAAREY